IVVAAIEVKQEQLVPAMRRMHFGPISERAEQMSPLMYQKADQRRQQRHAGLQRNRQPAVQARGLLLQRVLPQQYAQDQEHGIANGKLQEHGMASWIYSGATLHRDNAVTQDITNT